MNAALPNMIPTRRSFQAMRLSKISYDYTSLSECQIVIRFLGDEYRENNHNHSAGNAKVLQLVMAVR
jgi:hypothetical protein